MTPRISAVINTLNEEKNLPEALASVKSWVDEIIVVDMYSDDGTRGIAEAAGATVYLHERVGFVEPARAYGLTKVTGDWVLILDADERVSPALADRLVALAIEGQRDAIDVPFETWIFGHRMRGTGWGPHQEHHIRFFRNGTLDVDSTIHSPLRVIPDATLGRIPPIAGTAIVHLNYKNLAHWFEKMQRYTTIEAEQRFARNEYYRLIWWRFAGNFVLVFWSRFWTRHGYKDCLYGVLLSLLYAHYDATWRIKLWRKQQMAEDTPTITQTLS